MAERDVQDLERQRIAEVRAFQNSLRDDLDLENEAQDPKSEYFKKRQESLRQRRERGIRAINKKYAKKGGYKL